MSKELEKAEIKQIVEVVRQEDKRNFIRQLVSDNNNINEGSLVGLIAFVLLITIILADIFFKGFDVPEVYITPLVGIIVGGLGIGGAKSYREVLKKTVTFEKPE